NLAQHAARAQMSRIEAKAMALSTDDAALGKQREKSPFALDDAMRGSLQPQLDIPREVWTERYIDALVEGYLDSAANRDAPLGPNELTPIINALRETTQPQVRATLMQFVERYAQGREADIAQAANGADPDIAATFVQLLGRLQTPTARQALQQLAQSDDVNV